MTEQWNGARLPALIADDLGISRMEPDADWREIDRKGHDHFWANWPVREDGPDDWRVVNAVRRSEEYEDYPSAEWFECLFCGDSVHPRWRLSATQPPDPDAFVDPVAAFAE